jgi:hypothetical protein
LAIEGVSRSFALDGLGVDQILKVTEIVGHHGGLLLSCCDTFFEPLGLSLLFANTPRHPRAAHVALNFSRCRCTW